jgi:hypothetical protein
VLGVVEDEVGEDDGVEFGVGGGQGSEEGGEVFAPAVALYRQGGIRQFSLLLLGHS